MKIEILSLALLLGLPSAADAVNAKQVFSGKSDWITLNGVPVRKGTINATGINVTELDKLFAQNGSEEEIKQLIKDQKPLSRGLHAAGYFDMQPVDIFLSDSARQGRIMIAVLTLQVVPKILTSEVRKRLIELKKSAHSLLRIEIELALDGVKD